MDLERIHDINKTGLTFPEFLTGIFVGLKLGQFGVVASWSWLWVLSPLWISFLLAILIIFLTKDDNKKEEACSKGP